MYYACMRRVVWLVGAVFGQDTIRPQVDSVVVHMINAVCIVGNCFNLSNKISLNVVVKARKDVCRANRMGMNEP